MCPSRRLGRAIRRRYMPHELRPCVIVYDENAARIPSETTEIRRYTVVVPLMYFHRILSFPTVFEQYFCRIR